MSPTVSVGENAGQFCEVRYSTAWHNHISKTWIWQICAWRISSACDFSFSVPKAGENAIVDMLQTQSAERPVGSVLGSGWVWSFTVGEQEDIILTHF